MTAPTTRETADHAELLEKLKRVKYVREAHDEPHGTYDQPCDADDYGAEAVPVNPDGEAAAALRDLTAFVQSVSDVPLEDIELEYTAANILHGRGALTKGVKTEGVIAVKTLRAILRAARERLPSAPNQAKEAGE